MKRWARALYQPGIPLGQDGKRVTGSKEHIALSKEAAKEGMVLVKNENKVLPLAKGTRVALFGKGTFDYVKGGQIYLPVLPGASKQALKISIIIVE